MKQTKALYCLTVGFIHGARLDKTHNYDPVNGGYSLKAPFTPITFVKLCDLGQPLHHSGQTYIFGFAPQELVRLAALTKKDLEDALMVEQNWVNTTRKKLQSGWEKVVTAATTEAQAVERTGGELPVPSTATQTSNTPAATPPMMTGDETEEPAPASATSKPPFPATPPAAPAQEEPVTGTVERNINAYNVYVASAKASAADSLSVGFCAFVENLQTGEVSELGKGGYTKDFGKMVVLALRTAFDSGIIPPSTKAAQTLTTVYTSNDYVSKMFANNYLRSFAKKDWKKKDGSEIAHKDEWEGVWKQVSHMLAKGVLCEADSKELKDCTTKAQEFADADHQKRYGLIAPNPQNKHSAKHPLA